MRVNWFLLGLGVGAGIVILFAPQSGNETREMITEKVEAGKRIVKKRAEDLRHRAADLRDRAKDTADKGKEIVARQANAVSTAAEAAKEIYVSESKGQSQTQFP
jgi:gas vesicle protein